MSDDEHRVRQWCALLGWTWLPEGQGAPPDVFGVWVTESPAKGVFWVVVRDHAGARRYVVEPPTLAICTLVRHAGPVGVGPCPACEGDGVQHWGVTNPNRGPNEFRREGWLTRGGPQWSKHRSCPSCPPRAKNTKAARERAVHAGTGRRTVSAPEAVLMAAARECEAWRAVEAERGRAFPSIYHDDHCECGETGTIPGHEGAREALRALAEGWREHLPVLGDWLSSLGYFDEPCARGSIKLWARKHAGQLRLADWLEAHGGDDVDWLSHGLCPAVPRSLAECPAVARFVLSWLAGECERCLIEQAVLNRHVHECDSVTRHLPAIYAHLTVAWESATVKCPANCWPAAEGTMVKTQRETVLVVKECDRCTGLGRVKPKEQAA